MIQTLLLLLNLMHFESDAFSTLELNRNYYNRKIDHNHLFGTRSSSTNAIGFYLNKKTNTKTRGNEAKLYYQNPQDVKFWIDDTEVNVGDCSMASNSICLSEPDELRTHTSKLKDFAIEEKCFIDRTHSAASLISDEETDCHISAYSNENKCSHHLNHEKVKEKYEIALQNARDADLKYGLCSIESLNAWDILDEFKLS